MSTNLELIARALREINVIAENQQPSTEQGTQCLAKLNNLMELWKEADIDFGWSKQSSTTGTAPVPEVYELAVTTNLAIVCASQYGATVSQELATVADRTYGVILRKAQKEELENVDMSHLPEGSGHYGNRYDINTDV